MSRYALNLPEQLKHDAERWAEQQGVSLNQFILWAVAEKVGALNQQLDDPTFPQITYRRGASGYPIATVRGTGLRVQTLVIAAQEWNWPRERIAEEYDLTESQVREAQAFYNAHKTEVDLAISAEDALGRQHG